MAESATAERLQPTDVATSSEVYAHSMHTIGAVAIEGATAAEQQANYEVAHNDYHSAIIEMLKTDPEFRQYLDVDKTWRFSIINGQTCDARGVPVVDLVRKGCEISAQKALSDPRMVVQEGRDLVDLELAIKVDAMPVGTTIHGLSMEPKDQIKQDQDFWHGLGYREGIAYWQWYSKPSEDTLITGVLSIDLSDTRLWSEIFAELGEIVDPNESPNNWLTHTIEQQSTPEEAQAFVKQVRERYYQKLGAGHDRLSVSDYVAANQELLDTIFEAYYPELAKALTSKKNTTKLQDFARQILLKAKDLDDHARTQLLKVANSPKFDDERGRVIDSAVRYSVVEELRKGLKKMVHKSDPATPTQMVIPQLYGGLDPRAIHKLLASNVSQGTTAGRSYGGCAGQDNLTRKSRDQNEHSEDPLDPQDVFGGKAQSNESEDSNEGGACEYIHDGCYCCGLSDEGVPLPSRIKVRARRDAKGKASCLRPGCNAWLSSDGKQGDIGDIARKAERRRKMQKTPAVAYNDKQEA